MNEKLKVSDGLKVWIQDFLDSTAPQFKGKSPKERIKMAIAAFTDAGGKLKEGNMKERMDQSKLTGQEISVYFRKNPKAGKDKLVKKAVEFALDHGGAYTYAFKQIEKMKRGLTKHPEVKKALKYANESVHHESVWMMKGIISENYTRNFETLCQSLKLNGIQQKILDDFIHKGRIRDQYVGRAAGSKKETRIFAGKKKFSGSIDNRTEALMNALKVNAKQKSILDAYLKTGKVIGKYTGSIAGSTKTTKSYSGFRGFKEHFEKEDIQEQVSFAFDNLKTAQAFQKKVDGRPVNIVKMNSGYTYYIIDLKPDAKSSYRQKAAKIAVQMESVQIDEARFGKTMTRKELLRKFGKEMKDAIRKGTLELSTKAEEELVKYVMDNYPEEIPHDDPDIWVDWLDDNLEDFVKGRGYK